MNERIIKIGLESGMLNYVDNETPRHYFLSGHADEQDLAKFAELIVAECADLFVDRRYMVLNPLQPFADERVRVMKEHDKDTVRTIKRHFGVKE